ncbi:dual specificity protein kinase splA [Musca vetustissima]|uniref:dual specificity protein kinase splA n=1 Tax=Musca vetustissima TaxID=27455 RepID=UPI002AB7006B|nr:dual specificity protein kinase splA [Musca vetustissima]
MSLVIVKTSAIAIYSNKSSPNVFPINTNGNNNKPQLSDLSHFQATTSEFITTVPQTSALSATNFNYNRGGSEHKANNTVTNHIIRTNIIVGGSRDFEEPHDKMRAKLQQLLQREKYDDDEEKRQLQQDHHQQQQQQQQHLSVQEELQQQQFQHAISAGENAYLLERIDANSGGGAGGATHEQPIYGTWSTKAKRPLPPTKTGAANSTPAATSSMQTLIGEVEEHFHENHNYGPAHHYERLPRRSSTMTPVRRDLHDQIPRPPRLTSRQPSLANRRQFTDTPQPNGRDEAHTQPIPFHFPYDGPLPEEFKKSKQSERTSVAPYDEVNNIQDILQKLTLGGLASTKMPALMMMPSGLHISGSYKNLKSSGIANFFRGKRHKKQIQFPQPMPMFNGYQAPMMGFMPQAAYQSRIALEQIYPFKPRSPNDINLLAMQQQQQQQLKAQAQIKNSKKAKKNKKPKDKDKKNLLASSNVFMQHYPYGTGAPEMFYPTMYPPLMAINVTQAPPAIGKRVPFKLNLDIFPILPPSRNPKAVSTLAMEEARIVSTMRPASMLRNPFMEYYSTPITPTVSSLGFYNPYGQQKPHNHIRFPGAVQSAQSNNMQFNGGHGHQTPFLPIDCDPSMLPAGAPSTNSLSSPIMLHLNVFPKKKAIPSPSSPLTPSSTNPFYNNANANSNNNLNLHRSTIHEENEGESLSHAIEPRHQPKSLNISSQTSIERSDTTNSDQQRDLVDFEHPIVAANDISELPTPAALMGDNSQHQSTETSSSFHAISFYDHNNSANNTNAAVSVANSNYNHNSNTYTNSNTNTNNMEQMVSEAKTASLFRFPVEDLIQFQVHDAM